MQKKPLMTCMAIAAFAAFALPATASATNSPELVETAGGATVPIGATILGTNVGETTFLDTQGSPKRHCSTAHLRGTLLSNTGSAIAGEISSVAVGGTGAINAHNNINECTGSFGNNYITVETPLCVSSNGAMATHEFQVAGGTCAKPTGGVAFTIGSTTIGECKYKTTTSVKGDYVTGGSNLTVRPTVAGSGAPKTSGSFLCPSSGMLQMTFKLETANGTAISVE